MEILVLETSSTSIKALLYDSDTLHPSDSMIRVLRTEAYKNQPKDSSVLDPHRMLEQLLQLAKSVCHDHVIDVISIVSTWHSLVLCDKDGQGLSPIYLWSNQLANDFCDQFKDNPTRATSYYQNSGCIVSSSYPYFKLQVLRDAISKDQLILDQGSYIMKALTGEAVVLNSMASGTGLFSISKEDYDDELLRELKISCHHLPTIVNSSQSYPLLPDIANYLGLRNDVKMIAPGPDGAFNQLGSKALTEGIMTLSVGTSGALRLFSSKPLLSEHQNTWCYALEDGWLIGAATSGASNCVEYMKKQLFHDEISYTDLENGLMELVIPENAPIFLPFLFGERCPGWNNKRRSGIILIDDDFFPEHPQQKALYEYYATLEGVVFNLFQCFESLMEICEPPKTIRLSGGILNSAFWTQLCVDVFGVPMEVDAEKQASLMGGVYLAEKAFAPALKSRTGTASQRLHPQEKKASFYKKRYEQYKKLYSEG